MTRRQRVEPLLLCKLLLGGQRSARRCRGGQRSQPGGCGGAIEVGDGHLGRLKREYDRAEEDEGSRPEPPEGEQREAGSAESEEDVARPQQQV